jgi:hypothetical protein
MAKSSSRFRSKFFPERETFYMRIIMNEKESEPLKIAISRDYLESEIAAATYRGYEKGFRKSFKKSYEESSGEKLSEKELDEETERAVDEMMKKNFEEQYFKKEAQKFLDEHDYYHVIESDEISD